MSAPQPSAQTFETHTPVPAAIGRRVAAYAIDVAVAMVIFVLLALIVFVIVAFGVKPDPGVVVLLFGFAVAVWALAYTAMQGGRGSIGQRALGLQLCDVAVDEPIGFVRALVRNVIWALAAWIVVGYFTPLFDSSGRFQGWHDKVARAVVVDRRTVPATEAADFIASAPTVDLRPAPLVGTAADPDTSAVAVADDTVVDGIPVESSRPTQTAAPRRIDAAPIISEVPGARRTAEPATVMDLQQAPDPVPPMPEPVSAPAEPVPPAPAPVPPAPAPVPPAPAPVPPVPAPVPPVSPVPDPVPPDPAPAPGPPVVSAVEREEAQSDLDQTRVGSPAVPALVALTWDNGTRVAVYGRTLFGRNPAAEDGAVTVAVRDETLSLSKTHFEIGADDAGPWIVDRYSTNGSALVRAGRREQLTPGARVPLQPLDRLEFGDRSLTVGGER